MNFIKMHLYNNYGQLCGNYPRNRLKDNLVFYSETEKKSYYVRLQRKAKQLTNKLGKQKALAFAKTIIKNTVEPRILTDDAGERFPIGMVIDVMDLLNDYEIHVIDHRTLGKKELTVPIEPHESTPPIRDYQQKAVDIAVKERNGIIGIATAGGKTRIALEIIRKINRPFIFATAKDRLVTQFAFDLYEYVTGRYMDEKITSLTGTTFVSRLNNIMLKQFGIGLKCIGPNGVITTYHSLHKFAKDPYPVLIADECHHVAAKGFFANVAQCQSVVRIGMTASVNDRSDKLDVLNYAFLGPLIYRKTYEELRKEKYVSTAEVQLWPFDHFHEGEDLEKPQDIEDVCIVDNNKRNRFILNILANLSPHPVLVFVKKIRHGELLESLCTRHGIKAKFYSAENQDTDLIHWIKKPDGIIIATKILDTGMNSPSLQFALNAAGGRSSIAAEQQSGRLVRRTEKKRFATFIDIDDRNHRILHSQTVERTRKYVELGYEITSIEMQLAENLPGPTIDNKFSMI